MTKLAVKIVASIAAVYCAAYFFPAIRVDQPETYLWAGVILGVMNLIIRPILLVLTLPINIITLGLFTLILNTWLVIWTDSLLPGLSIPSFRLAFLTALIVSLSTVMIGALVDPKKQR